MDTNKKITPFFKEKTEEKLEIRKIKVITASIALFFSSSVLATNGYFLPGSGFRSQGMGGVGIAYGRDSLSTAANPANIVNTGMRGDMGFGVFNPERHAAVGTGTGLPGGDGTPGGGSAFGFTGNTESDSKYFIMPEMGFTMPIDSQLSAGLAFVGNGGMNTTYPQNFFSFFGNPPADNKIGVDMMQLLVPVTVGYRVNEDHSIGASVVLAETRFRAYGLEAFANFPGVPSNSAYVTGKGFDYSYGAGLRLGWLGEFANDTVTLGLTYGSRTYMTKFENYRSLFAEGGDFDIPENYGIGIAFKPTKNLVIAADVMRINYSDIASIGNRGPGNNPGGLGTNGVPSLNTADPNRTDKQLGKDQGMGFGWKDQTVYKIGINYGVNSRLQLRAGFNYGKSPIPDDQITFNLLAPATVEKHYTVGFTYKANDNLELTGSYLYAAPHSQSNCNQNIIDCASFNMHQNMFAFSAGWVLDPGVTDYGDTPSSAKDYEFGSTNFYAGLGIGRSRYSDFAKTSGDMNSEGWKFLMGYQLNKYLGIEGGYVNLNDMTSTLGTVRTNIDTDGWALGAVVRYPVTGKLSVMGKVGGAYLLSDIKTKNGAAVTVRTEDDSFEPNYGLGFSYALMDDVDLRLEWERFARSRFDVDMVTAGVVIGF